MKLTTIFFAFLLNLGLPHAEFATAHEILLHSASCKLFPQGFDIAQGRDDVALGRAIAQTPSHCCAICEKKPGCQAWAWNWYGPTCYLTSITDMEPARDTTTRAGIVGKSATCSVQTGTGFSISLNENLAILGAQTPGDCCGLCAGNPECRGWTFRAQSCSLKSNITLVPFSDDISAVGMLLDNLDSNENEITDAGPAPE